MVFAVNGGMFTPDFAPVGLYIQRQQEITPLHTGSIAGNFGLKPNGVFYLTTELVAVVCETAGNCCQGNPYSCYHTHLPENIPLRFECNHFRINQ
jgi:uncharacterized protein YigE (DUF2233 family)